MNLATTCVKIESNEVYQKVKLMNRMLHSDVKFT